MRKVLADYNEIQFIQFMNELLAANDGASDDVLDQLLEEFERLTEHPDGSDLIYYPEDEALCTPEGITEIVKQWRQANGFPGFKPRF